MAYFLFILISIIWGASFILMKKAGLAFGPLTIGAWRCAGGALILLLIWLCRNRRWHLQRQHAVPFAVLVISSYLWPYTIQPYLVQGLGSGFIGLMLVFVPLATIIVSVPLLRLLPTRRQVLGVAIGLLFCSLLFLDSLQQKLSIGDVLLAFTVPVAYAIGNTVNKRWLSGLPPVFLAGAAMVLGSVILIPIAFVFEDIGSSDGLLLPVGALVVLGVIGTGLAIAMFYRLIHERGPLFAGMVTYLIPIGAVVWGWLDGESVTILQVIALVGTSVAVALTQYRPRPPMAPVCGADDAETASDG